MMVQAVIGGGSDGVCDGDGGGDGWLVMVVAIYRDSGICSVW